MTKKLSTAAFALLAFGMATASFAATINPEIRQKFEETCDSIENAEFVKADGPDRLGRYIDKCKIAVEAADADADESDYQRQSRASNALMDRISNGVYSEYDWRVLEDNDYMLSFSGNRSDEAEVILINGIN
ncbi:MAG: hypothetical protein LBG89_00580 [Rickettsiales bacterium]|jgi:hypothetical protein|nr:hypothetical protein [Rickettsiales bacterium]